MLRNLKAVWLPFQQWPSRLRPSRMPAGTRSLKARCQQHCTRHAVRPPRPHLHRGPRHRRRWLSPCCTSPRPRPGPAHGRGPPPRHQPQVSTAQWLQPWRPCLHSTWGPALRRGGPRPCRRRGRRPRRCRPAQRRCSLRRLAPTGRWTTPLRCRSCLVALTYWRGQCPPMRPCTCRRSWGSNSLWGTIRRWGSMHKVARAAHPPLGLGPAARVPPRLRRP